MINKQVIEEIDQDIKLKSLPKGKNNFYLVEQLIYNFVPICLGTVDNGIGRYLFSWSCGTNIPTIADK